jgi:2-hydroxychromene-2-carboxylate isomerase
VDEDETPIWERPDPTAESGILALAVGVAVRDHLPERFLDAHVQLFAARHDRGEDIKDPDVIRKALDAADVDADRMLDLVASGEPLATVRAEHDRNVAEHGVWGVPTFVGSERSVFVRLLDRPEGDAERARRHIDRVVDLVDGWPELHEFKQADLPM